MKLLLQSLVERSLYVVMLLVVGFNIFIAFQVQTVIHANQESTLAARKANIARQSQMEGYIKCILLLRYDNPNLTPQSSREEVETALDKCAQKVKE